MPYLNNDGDSRLNNFPTEPKMYVAESNEGQGQRNYLAIGIIGLVLTIGSVSIAMAVS